ncbi:peptide ABC transporter substrate-binding protein [Virgibacillus phasianinus]|uniref:Peptide ABC transporter substrate-binding protein n=1 Tax=Virgibacillus phasianinus TaxID=2017483 RepID=A0A220U224_9BACI|nr:peptide ABC transporter substrate-binding protein [Virgibacillus phasianinus]ASK61986.1 peptide ABC transporter substrate-binding protein [Virgibacillus phasianinus]
MKLSKFSLLLALGLLLSVFMVACSSGDESSKDSGGDSDKGTEEKAAAEGEDVEQVLNLLESDTIPTMDVSMATDEIAFIYLGNTMEGLYRLGEDAKMTPGIAKDHTVSDDGLTWTFNLREDAKWSNGDPVTANDFVYAWQRAVDPKTGSEYGPYMMGGVIKNATKVNEGEMPVEKLGVKAKDDYTLVVTLEKPTPYFESLTAFGTFYPLNQKFVEAQGDKYATSSDTLLSNGPFVIKDWKSTSTSWNLVKNDKYWDAEAVNLNKLTFNVVKDPQVGVDLYEKGKVHRAGISSDLVDKYSSHDDFTITPEASLFYLKFNQTTSDALANVNIRKALSMSINKQALVDEVINNGSVVSNGFVPANFSFHPETGEDFREINGDLVTYDKEKAKELWEKGLKEIGKDKVSLEFLGGDGETTKIMNEYLANQMQSNLPGLDITLVQVPFEQRLEKDTNMDYQIQFSGWGPDYLDPYTWLNLWLTDGGNNKMGYSNPEYDKLVQSTVNELALEPVKRYEAFLEAEKILAEDAAVAPLYQSARAQLISPQYQGVINNPMGATYDYKWASVGAAE